MIPELSEVEYESLKFAIREAGRVLVPVVVTSDGEVIDGKGRKRAAGELKITEYPREVVHGLDAEGRELMRLQLNCVRRHLGDPLCQKTCVILTMPLLPGEDDWVDVGSVSDSA